MHNNRFIIDFRGRPIMIHGLAPNPAPSTSSTTADSATARVQERSGIATVLLPCGSIPMRAMPSQLPGRCRPCELPGLGLSGTTGLWETGWQAPPEANRVPNVDTGPVAAGQSSWFWPTRSYDLGLGGPPSSELCRWEPLLTRCGRPRSGRTERVCCRWHLPEISDELDNRHAGPSGFCLNFELSKWIKPYDLAR